MGQDMAGDPALDRIESLLATERKALLSGKLKDLPQLSIDRDKLLVELVADSIDKARLQDLRRLALRNTELAQAARDGVQAALARLAAIRAADGPIVGYSADGGQVHIGAIQPAFERKA